MPGEDLGDMVVDEAVGSLIPISYVIDEFVGPTAFLASVPFLLPR